MKIKKFSSLILIFLMVFGLSAAVYADNMDSRLDGFINLIAAAEENRIETIDCSGFGLTVNEVRYAFSLAEMKNPFVYGVREFEYFESGEGTVSSITLLYDFTMQEQLRQRTEINNIIKKIVAETEEMTNSEKIKTIYSYFEDNITYDYKLSDKDYNIHTLFTENRGRCKTFSLAFKLIMDELDIPCKVVTNLASPEQDLNKAYHVWNKVYVNDKWLTVDITNKIYLVNELMSMVLGLR